MSLFFESIKIENGQPANIFFHNERFNKTRRDVLSIKTELNLEKVIEIPNNLKNSIYKCRIFYDHKIDKIEFIEYKKRNIEKIQLVKSDLITYPYKYSDRKEIEKLKKKFTSSEEEDIIIIKDGFLTDSSFSNLLLFDGKHWITPAKPLLSGTQLAKLLSEKRVIKRNIHVKNLHLYNELKLINAMIKFEDAISFLIDNIKT